MASPLLIQESSGGKALPPAGFALWNLGFRPFYLLAGIFAVIGIAIWVAHFSGWLPWGDYLRDPLWHAHEMIFGYAYAVIVGFLFTAVRNWTGQPTPSGAVLAMIVALWVEARLLLVLGLPIPAAIVDLAFAIAAAWGIAMPLLASGNRRNMLFIALLLAIGCANLVFSLSILGIVAVPPRQMLGLALDLILIIMVIIGGRVIPMFTANGVAQGKVRQFKWLEICAIGSVVALLLADLLNAPSALLAIVTAFAALTHALRLGFWRPWQTLRKPIVWILHCAYLWIVLHLVLRSFAAVGMTTASLATHALTVGAIGGLTLGMMTRTSRGHSGRPLTTGHAELACYLLVQMAAMVRVLLPLAAPGLYMTAVTCSGVLWVAAFAVFVVAYAPILWRPRLDGKPV